MADSPGFGKSASVATFVVSSKMIEDAWRAVRQSWKSSDPTESSQHLPQATESNPQAKDAKCPSQDSIPICCPCVESGPTAKLPPTYGIVIFVVPTPLLINSVEEWWKQVDMKANELDFNVHAQTTMERGKKKQMVKLQEGEETRSVDVFDLYMKKDDANKLREKGIRCQMRGLSRFVFFTTSRS